MLQTSRRERHDFERPAADALPSPRRKSRPYGPGADGSLALADAHRVSLGLEPFPQEHSKKKSHAKKRLRELKLTLLIVGCVVGSLLILALALYCGREYRKTYARARELERHASAVVSEQCDEAERRTSRRIGRGSFRCWRKSSRASTPTPSRTSLTCGRTLDTISVTTSCPIYIKRV